MSVLLDNQKCTSESLVSGTKTASILDLQNNTRTCFDDANHKIIEWFGFERALKTI